MQLSAYGDSILVSSLRSREEIYYVGMVTLGEQLFGRPTLGVRYRENFPEAAAAQEPKGGLQGVWGTPYHGVTTRVF